VPAQVADNAAAFGAETWAGVPYMFEHVARHVTAPFPPTIRTVISAGARLPFDVVEAFHRRTGHKVHSFYGSSETGGICYDDTDTLSSDVPVGRPLGETRVSLRADPDAPPASGRVIVHGPGVIDGYADGVDADAFDDGGFVTGDFGRFTSDGQLVLTGRASSVVNVAGRKVAPGDVETAMRAVPGVRDVVVLGVQDERRGQTIGACFVASDRIGPMAMRTALAPLLASHKLPRVIVQVEALPLTGRGKPDRQAIARMLEQARRDG
jgi:long-chain acyl-CoA synthetase